jgi:hypothetical protein
MMADEIRRRWLQYHYMTVCQRVRRDALRAAADRLAAKVAAYERRWKVKVLDTTVVEA